MTQTEYLAQATEATIRWIAERAVRRFPEYGYPGIIAALLREEVRFGQISDHMGHFDDPLFYGVVLEQLWNTRGTDDWKEDIVTFVPESIRSQLFKEYAARFQI